MVDGGRALATLDRILDRYRVVQHGVSMYSARPNPLTANICGASRLSSSAPRPPGC
jgi:uncharacterized protein (UPF0276 family)